MQGLMCKDQIVLQFSLFWRKNEKKAYVDLQLSGVSRGVGTVLVEGWRKLRIFVSIVREFWMLCVCICNVTVVRFLYLCFSQWLASVPQVQTVSALFQSFFKVTSHTEMLRFIL